ncbi:hypothetical protein ASPTUDRAFT_197796 [Aspergillus tubingensis CBS 134.48]|uniref:26S proteasome complex subunit SEM1 n=2 Tax=Aspergillus subgen. Circumdati TaxID=2720871 RepID=A0A1L9NN58_ASPTC|nr:hypothetical protein ASPTUDRAFT_197796 [Aspergillus tubingensis CBS 134.48]GAQ41539.1 26S proteasome complex subunit sem-1 [Aspergillus niger]
MSNPTATQDTKAEPTQQPQQQKPPVLEEDDEFEDFPVEDWPQEETEQGSAANGASAHLWEESWDDDDAAEDFSKQLKYVFPSSQANPHRSISMGAIISPHLLQTPYKAQMD